jgi:hypothetical protein
MNYEIALFRRITETQCEITRNDSLLPEDLEDLGVVGWGVVPIAQ